MVEDMGLNDAVHEGTANEAELTIDCRSSTTSERPGFGFVMREGGVGVLEICDRD